MERECLAPGWRAWRAGVITDSWRCVGDLARVERNGQDGGANKVNRTNGVLLNVDRHRCQRPLLARDAAAVVRGYRIV